MSSLSKLLFELEQNTHELEEQILAWNEAEFRTPPSPGKWSASDVLAHLCILEGFINQVVEGNTETSTRPSEKMVKIIQSTFLQIERKLVAPDAIHPKPGVVKTREEMLAKFRKNRNQLGELLQKQDITLICKNFSHHFFGELTRIEWGYVELYHAQRHMQQLAILAQERV